MIWNIIDRRGRPYRWAKINAVIEATRQDNSCEDADLAPAVRMEDIVTYDDLKGVSLNEAINWANQQSCPVTLYLYDDGKGI